MTDLNRVSLVGRLTKDATTKPIGNTNVIEVSIACNRSVKKGEQWVDEVSYFEASYFTKGTKMADMLKKGTQIAIDGSLKQDRWQGKDGKNASKIVILADNLQILVGKSNGQQQENQQPVTPNNVQSDIPF